MEESQVVAGWIAQGEEIGLEIGLEKGIEIGRREILRDDLIVALEVRFGETLAVEIRTIIQAENDLGRLSRWFRVALTCPSLNSFQAEMKENG